MHAKQLKCDVNSKQFKDTMRYLWMPRLVERIQAANAGHPTATATTSGGSTSTTTTTTTATPGHHAMTYSDNFIHAQVNSNFTPENSANSSDSFGTQISDFDYYGIPINNNQDYIQGDQVYYVSENPLSSPNCGYINNQGMDYQGIDANYNTQEQQQWPFGVGDTNDSLWNVEDIYMLQQQFSNM